MSEMLQAALRYAALGFWIFPLHSIRFDKKCGCGDEKCGSPGKHPRIKWKSGASCDVEVVRSYWTKWPNAGIGLATGPSGLIVFDLDGPKGVTTFKELCNSGGIATPITARARTARGMHVFFKGQSPTFSNTETKLDVRSIGGYVVLSPSPHVSGHVYRWEVEPESGIAECPAPLLAYASDSSTRAQRRRAAGGQGVGGMSGAPRGAPALSAAEDSFTTRLSASLEAPDWSEVDRALAYIPADCSMDKWIKVGMALHAARDPSGWERWNRWSSTACARAAGKYKGEDEIAYKWTTFKHEPGGVGIGTLFAFAKEHGWSFDKRSSFEKPSGREEVVPTDVRYNESPETRPPLEDEAGAAPKEGMNGHAPALPDSFREASVVFQDRDKKGPKATCRNVRVAMRAIGVTAEEDEFHDRMRIGGQPIGEWAGELTDNAVFMLRSLVERTYGFDPSTQMVYEAAVQECLANRYHPIKKYFESLQWDGEARLDTWMCRYLGAARDPFNTAVSRLSLIAAVRRVLQPGCKFDNIIVLEGVEGRGKSSAIEILAGPDNFSDQMILGLRDREQQEVVQGVWLYEIADLAGHSRTEVEKVKAFASRTIDRARPAFGRKRVDMPRKCIFFATTNDRTYLKSQTGNRRFWPVECGAVDLEGLRRDRDQLWAEAVRAERQRGSIVLDEKLWSVAATLQESRRDRDPWDDLLSNLEKSTWCKREGDEWRVTSRTLMDDVLRLPSDRQSDVAAKRMAHALRRLGWEPKLFKLEGSVYRGYAKQVTGE